MAHQSTSGIHHITAISSSAVENLHFYERVLGLRLVKQTVNFDDPYTYHLYYGGADGAPGTILTFFPWDRTPRGRPGAGMIVAIAFDVAHEAISYWAERLHTRGIEVQTESRLGEPVLRFKDPHGLPIELIGTEDVCTHEFASLGPEVPTVSPDWSPVAKYGGYDNSQNLRQIRASRAGVERVSSRHMHSTFMGPDGRVWQTGCGCAV